MTPRSRAALFLVAAPLAGCGLGVAVFAACATTAPNAGPSAEAADAGRPPAQVAPLDASLGAVDGGYGPSCTTYCDTLATSCTGANAQYPNRNDCLDLCVLLPDGVAGENDTNSVACRQYWAGTPALTDPESACLAAGPFGGNVCGDRCLAFCQTTLAACPSGPYATQPECAAACAGYTFRDAGADGGGETPAGPAAGDTLNCRLYWLRQAIGDAGACAYLAADSGACL